MNSNIDVLNELKNKNKEIYLNKLMIDIENNSEILELTINNMVDLLTSEMINKISEIQNKIDIKKIDEIVKSFQNKIQKELIRLINNRSSNLKMNISIDQEFNYKEKLEIETNILINGISKYYRNNLSTIINKLEIDMDSFGKDRLNDYFNVLYYERLINKLKEILNDKDMILCNNYQAGLLKYQNMNEKTLNWV